MHTFHQDDFKYNLQWSLSCLWKQHATKTGWINASKSPACGDRAQSKMCTKWTKTKSTRKSCNLSQTSLSAGNHWTARWPIRGHQTPTYSTQTWIAVQPEFCFVHSQISKHLRTAGSTHCENPKSMNSKLMARARQSGLTVVHDGSFCESCRWLKQTELRKYLIVSHAPKTARPWTFQHHARTQHEIVLWACLSLSPWYSACCASEIHYQLEIAVWNCTTREELHPLGNLVLEYSIIIKVGETA